MRTGKVALMRLQGRCQNPFLSKGRGNFCCEEYFKMKNKNLKCKIQNNYRSYKVASVISMCLKSRDITFWPV